MSEWNELNGQLQDALKEKDFARVVEVGTKLKEMPSPAAPTIDELVAQLDEAKQSRDFSRVIKLSNALMQKRGEGA